MNYERIIDLTMREGGGTFDMKTGETVRPESGYAVGAAWGTFHKVTAENTDLVLAAIQAVQREYKHVAAFGTWFDGRFIYVDPVIIFPSRERQAALALARQNMQKAIYDFETGETIEIHYAGVRL